MAPKTAGEAPTAANSIASRPKFSGRAKGGARSPQGAWMARTSALTSIDSNFRRSDRVPLRALSRKGFGAIGRGRRRNSPGVAQGVRQVASFKSLRITGSAQQPVQQTRLPLQRPAHQGQKEFVLEAAVGEPFAPGLVEPVAERFVEFAGETRRGAAADHVMIDGQPRVGGCDAAASRAGSCGSSVRRRARSRREIRAGAEFWTSHPSRVRKVTSSRWPA